MSYVSLPETFTSKFPILNWPNGPETGFVSDSGASGVTML